MKRTKRGAAKAASTWQDEGSFLRGMVVSACLAAFQGRQQTPFKPKELKRIVRYALQGGVALYAGTNAAIRWRQGDCLATLLYAAAGAAGVYAVEKLLPPDASETMQDGPLYIQE